MQATSTSGFAHASHIGDRKQTRSAWQALRVQADACAAETSLRSHQGFSLQSCCAQSLGIYAAQTTFALYPHCNRSSQDNRDRSDASRSETVTGMDTTQKHMQSQTTRG